MIFLNAMPFYYLGRGERNPHSLQQPRGDTYTREVLSLTPPRRPTRLQERCRQNFRLVIHRFHVHAINLSVYLDTGSGNHRRLLNVSELAESLGEEYCATLLGVCAFCGEYCTKQYLQEKGNVGPLRMMDNNPNCVHAIWRRMEHPTRSSPPGIG